MKNKHPVTEMADTLSVSASGYADHQLKDEQPYHQQNASLAKDLQAVFEENRHTYGLPRLRIALRKKDWDKA